MNTATIWRTTLERLEQAPVDAVSKAWLQDSHLSSVARETVLNGDAAPGAREQTLSFTLQVPNSLARDVVNTRWRRSIEDILEDVVGQPVALSVIENADEAEDAVVEAPEEDVFANEEVPETDYAQDSYTYYDIVAKRPLQPELQYISGAAADSLEEWDNEQRANILMHNRLNPRYTFDAFIVGNSNRLAHAASLAVAEAPGESYNPLFLYGGVGLGKTHLLHAIGHQGVHTGLAVLYVSSEQFTNEIVNAIRYRTTEEFRAKYRSVDILLVDDIQFIAGKESTEEEFFHTFNSLYEMSKQIVICSDRPPKAIVSLEERLRSRFEWGLIADIQPPDLETRMAILRVKADMLHYRVPDEIIAYIAGRVQTNIRELEGCLNRLMAYQQLHRTDLTLAVAREAMSSLGSDNRETNLNIHQIAQAVAEYYHISLEAMCGKQRDKHIVVPRQIAMYLIRQETQASLLEVGQLFGGRDHSTVLHACEKIEKAVNLNPQLRREIIAIREQLSRE
ncbi:MAG TPA: chromosomal replication initiator protein DnaA [Ktedonobacteraceae bacterium]|nr:chromosomal replication initiator protein DnaA [Ktedonobacteraceae bacterium]